MKEVSKVTKFDDLKKLKVGVQTGTTGDEAVTKLLGKTSTNIKRFESTPLALKELEAGGVDAVVADNGVIIHYVANNPAASSSPCPTRPSRPSSTASRSRRATPSCWPRSTRALAEIKADGTYDKIYAQYFGAAARRRRSARVSGVQVGLSTRQTAMDLRWEILAGYGPLFLSGLWMTIELTLVLIGAGLAARPRRSAWSSSSADAPVPHSPWRWRLKMARGVTRGLRDLLPRHAAVRADPAGALCADADADPPRRRAAARAATRRAPSARNTAPSSPVRWR